MPGVNAITSARPQGGFGRTSYFVSRPHAAGGARGRFLPNKLRITAYAAYNERQAASAMKFTRITVEADKMGGVPCIRGLRVPVATVVAMVADGMNERQILEAYSYLEPEDIKEALRYAAEAVRERAIPLTSP